MFTIGVFAVILDNNDRVLLCHRRDHDLWNLPGGGLEAGESPKDGVIREVKEETGLNVDVDELVGVYNKGKRIVFTFLCKVVSGKSKLTSEADIIEYFSIDDIPKNTAPKHVERIEDALEEQDDVVFKQQTGPSSIELLKRGKL